VERRPILAAIGVLIAFIIAGAILMGIGITLIGIVVFVASLPAALVAWLAAD
jgi:hypothetical protein